MNDAFLVTSEEIPGVSLRTVAASDCEHLRLWKNANRNSFFFRKEISPEQQRAWFAGYLARPHDWMFVVEFEDRRDQPVGCMGFRLVDGQADVYNVILGSAEHKGRGIMAAALRVMCCFAKQQLQAPVVARVLTTNPALGWYTKHGFEVQAHRDDHCFIELSESRFEFVNTVRKEVA